METDEYIRPPGTYYDIIAHPTNLDEATEIAVVQDHRFAFFYWLKWRKSLAAQTQPPTLVSLDWHQDLAPPEEDECDDLRELDTSDFRAVAFFCWDKLHRLNDGHILAAAYLNIIGDIHVAQKQEAPSVDQFTDFNGNIHTIYCYDSIENLIQSLTKQITLRWSSMLTSTTSLRARTHAVGMKSLNWFPLPISRPYCERMAI